ncbi:hypothetical protein, partial [Pseudomonas syringae]|uniref:hypothetical protein n=1 Tax=Pseudomonas syringae TaxID=317 RepID=UPI001F40B5F9
MPFRTAAAFTSGFVNGKAATSGKQAVYDAKHGGTMAPITSPTLAFVNSLALSRSEKHDQNFVHYCCAG